MQTCLVDLQDKAPPGLIKPGEVRGHGQAS